VLADDAESTECWRLGGGADDEDTGRRRKRARERESEKTGRSVLRETNRCMVGAKGQERARECRGALFTLQDIPHDTDAVMVECKRASGQGSHAGASFARLLESSLLISGDGCCTLVLHCPHHIKAVRRSRLLSSTHHIRNDAAELLKVGQPGGAGVAPTAMRARSRRRAQVSDDSDIEGHPNVDHKSLVRCAPRPRASPRAI
jgi:hypothetical protein